MMAVDALSDLYIEHLEANPSGPLASRARRDSCSRPRKPARKRSRSSAPQKPLLPLASWPRTWELPPDYLANAQMESYQVTTKLVRLTAVRPHTNIVTDDDLPRHIHRTRATLHPRQTAVKLIDGPLRSRRFHNQTSTRYRLTSSRSSDWPPSYSQNTTPRTNS